MNLDKEIFLRDKMYSLYNLAVTTIIKISSAAMALSAGFDVFSQDPTLCPWLIYISWLFLLASIFLMLWMMVVGVEFYVACYKNLREGREEISGIAINEEQKLPSLFYSGVISFFIGMFLLAAFISINIAN